MDGGGMPVMEKRKCEAWRRWGMFVFSCLAYQRRKCGWRWEKCLVVADKEEIAKSKRGVGDRQPFVCEARSQRCISYSVWAYTHTHSLTHTHTHKHTRTCKDESLVKQNKWMNEANCTVYYSEMFWLCSFLPPHHWTECLSSQIKLLCVLV